MKKKVIVSYCALFIFTLMVGCAQSAPVPAESAPTEKEEPASAAPKQPETKPESESEPAEAPIAASSKIPLIFSHDGAPDDIAAMAYIAKHPDINLIGVVNSYGEQHPSRSKDEWQRYIYEVIDSDETAFGLGAEKSLDPEQNQFPAGWRDSADDFWYVNLPPASGGYQSPNGADLQL